MRLLFLIIIALLSGCTVGPDYHRPVMPTPAAYKEIKETKWSAANPDAVMHHGKWWLAFHSKTLNQLESELNISNQNIAAAAAQYQQSLDLVRVARAAYFPTLGATVSIAQQGGSSGSFVSGANGAGGVTNVVNNNVAGNQNSISQAILMGSWVPDIWGSVRRNVEASRSASQMSAAQLAGARLSAQTSLAQYYYELRGVDSDRYLLLKTVEANKKILALTENLYHNGVDSMVDIVSARTQLENSQALLINLGVNRGQYEHAIAMLIGKAPADLSIPYHPFFGQPPVIPAQLPSQLLERRPDIASAERAMAQANAQVGVAIAAYYPTFTISPTFSVQGTDFFESPFYSWSLGPSIAETLLDGNLRVANTAAARANYDAVVAQYRQTVLAAFQNVEDNLVAVRVLKKQGVVQDKAARDANLALQLTLNQYESGTASYPNVLTAQINAYNAEKSAVDVTTLRMTSTVGLISALGGGWQAPKGA